MKCYSVPWWSEVLSSVTVTEFVLVASVETVNSSLPLAMSDSGLDTKMCLKIWTAMCFLIWGIFLKLMDRKEKTELTWSTFMFWKLHDTSYCQEKFCSYVVYFFTPHIFLVACYMETCMKLIDHVTKGVHINSVHLYVFNDTDFDMNSSHSRWTGVKLSAHFVSVCWRIIYSLFEHWNFYICIKAYRFLWIVAKF